MRTNAYNSLQTHTATLQIIQMLIQPTNKYKSIPNQYKCIQYNTNAYNTNANTPIQCQFGKRRQSANFINAHKRLQKHTNQYKSYKSIQIIQITTNQNESPNCLQKPIIAYKSKSYKSIQMHNCLQIYTNV